MHVSYSNTFIVRKNYTFHVKLSSRDTGQDAGSERRHAARTRGEIRR